MPRSEGYSLHTYRHFYNGSFYFIRRDQFDPKVWNLTTYFVPPDVDTMGLDWREVEQERATKIYSDTTLKACSAFALKHAVGRVVTIERKAPRKVEKKVNRETPVQIQAELPTESELPAPKKRSDFEAFMFLMLFIGTIVLGMHLATS